jgi:hypothetical protein
LRFSGALARFFLRFLLGLGMSSMYCGTGHPEARRTFAMLSRTHQREPTLEGAHAGAHVRRYGPSSLLKKVIAFPGLPALPVRPMRWM